MRSSTESWNIRFPIDRWWRQKHSIPYGSKAHLEQNMADMVFEYHEDILYHEISLPSPKYKEGDWLKEHPKSEQQIADIFDKIDIKNIDL